MWYRSVYLLLYIIAVSTDTGNLHKNKREKRSTTSSVLWQCDFESPCPDLHNLTEGLNYYWRTYRGATHTADTGPQADHTVGDDNGTYLYAESSAPSMAGNEAVLTTTAHVADKREYCLRLHYHMYGRSMGKFLVQFISPNRPGRNIDLFEINGDQGDEWKALAELVRPAVGETFLLQLKATRGPSYESDIAIDDFRVTEGTCESARHPSSISTAFALVADTGSNKILKLDMYNTVYQQLTVKQRGFKMQNPTDVTYDATDMRVFWSDTKAGLHGVNLDGDDHRSQKSKEEGSTIEGVVVYRRKQIANLYFTSYSRIHSGAARIGAISLTNGSTWDVLTSNLDKPRDIQIDLFSEHLYVSDLGQNPKILRTSMEGTDTRAIIAGGMTRPSGLYLDLPAGKLYWCDSAYGRIEVANLDGTGRTVLHQDRTDRYGGITLWQQHIYITVTNSRHLYRMLRNGTGYEKCGDDVLTGARGITMHDTQDKQKTWTLWSDWSDCSLRCTSKQQEFGESSRSRRCLNGAGCTGKNRETALCSPPACRWRNWGPWGECHENCNQARTRTCLDGQKCDGNDKETKTCCHRPPGRWMSWLSWSRCSTKCTRTRKRFCTGGLCSSKRIDIQKGTCTDCGSNPTSSSWGDWSECSQSCGGGNRTRTRSCSPAGGSCSGEKKEEQNCNTNQCNPCVFSTWSEWSTCSTTCGNGIKRQTRFCRTCPKCDGPIIKVESCVMVPKGSCQGWDDWSRWGLCSRTCGVGIKFRERECSQFNCHGHNQDVKLCQNKPCQGVWRQWNEWSNCPCGNEGKTNRTRSCDTANCVGEETVSKSCPVKPCRG